MVVTTHISSHFNKEPNYDDVIINVWGSTVFSLFNHFFFFENKTGVLINQIPKVSGKIKEIRMQNKYLVLSCPVSSMDAFYCTRSECERFLLSCTSVIVTIK